MSLANCEDLILKSAVRGSGWQVCQDFIALSPVGRFGGKDQLWGHLKLWSHPLTIFPQCDNSYLKVQTAAERC